MDDVDPVAEPKAKGKRQEEEEPEDIGAVSDFIELINTTVGRHFKCCICFSILEDPVMLPCNHPLCRGCATQCLRQNQRCPQCLAAIPNLRMLQGRNTWIAEMVCSLKNCLNEVGVSLTQHAPVPPKYRDKSPPKTGAAGAAVRQRARARARASSGDASRAQLSAVSCGGGGGSSRSVVRGRGGARPKGGGTSSNGPSRATSTSGRTESTSRHPSDTENENAVVMPLPPSSPPPPVPPPRPFVVGDLVSVEHRTWPGMNKHGGVALVTAVLDPPGSRYDVKYTVGRKHERGVEARYVHSYAFPDETLGSRSRRSVGGTRAGRHPVGSSGGSARDSLPPRRRSREPVSAPPAGGATTGSTDSSATTVIGPASPAAAGAASSVSNPFTPRPERAVGKSGGASALRSAEEEGPHRERTADAATATAAADAIPIATASSPAAAGGRNSAASTISETVSGCGGGAKVAGRGDDDGVPSRCDNTDTAEGSHVSDAASTSTIREEDAERAAGEGYSFDNAGGMDYGGSSYNDGRDDNSEGTAPVVTEGDIEGNCGVEVPAEAFSRPGVVDKEADEGKKEETRRMEEMEDLTDDRRKSLSLSGVGCGAAGGAVDGLAAPLSPTSRSNHPWRPPPQSDGPGTEQPLAGQRRRLDPPPSFSASDTRDTSDLMLAGAAEGLMALAANHRMAPVAAAGVEEAEEDPRMEGGDDDDETTESEAETSTPPPQSPRDRSDEQLHLQGSSSSSSSPRGREIARSTSATSAGARLPTSSPAATAPSPFSSQRVNSSRPSQHQDDTPVASSTATAAAAVTVDNRRDNGGDDTDPMPSRVGDLVSVPSRSSPGVNKEGGVAKVTLARPDGTFDVKYIVRQGREKRVAAAILSPYKVDGIDGGGGGGGNGKRHSGEHGGAVAAASPDPSRSFPPPSMRATARGAGGTSAVRRTPRSNKGWCSPDIAAGQANAACLNYMLGDTQHPELDLDPDLGELLDPNEGTTSSSSSAPAGKARKQRDASSSATAAAAVANTVLEDGERLGGDGDDGKAVSGWQTRDSSIGGRRKNRGSGNKRKRPARGRGEESEDETDGNGSEKHSSGGSQSQSQGGSSQGQGRRRRRRSSSEDINSGDGDASKKDIFDITALTADSDSEGNAAARLVAAAVSYEGVNGSSSHEIFDITALSPGSDVADNDAPATKKRSRPSGGSETPRGAAVSIAEAVGEKRSSGKGKAIGGSGGGGASGSSGGTESKKEKGKEKKERRVESAGGRRGRATAANPESEKPVVLTLSGSTPEMLTLANTLVKSLGWRVEPKYTEDVTHVVCGTVEKNTDTRAKVRSAKFLRAVASGKWVVTEAWLQECKRRGGRVKEEAFEVSGDRKSPVPSAPRRSRLAHANPDRPGLFHGVSFHFRGHFGTTGSPPLSELEAMLRDNGGRVVTTIGSLYTLPAGAGGGSSNDNNSHGSGRRSESSSSSNSSSSGSGAWRPQRVVIFQPSSESPEDDARVLEEDLACAVEAEMSKQASKTSSLSAEGARARGGGAGDRGAGPDNMAIEVVKPIWLVDSVGCFRVLIPSVHHRLPSDGAVA
eukprot:g9796.t1